MKLIQPGVVIVIILVTTVSSMAQPTGYNFGKQLIIQESEIPGTTALTNFPVLVRIASDNDLRSTANGGNVESASGFDIVFTADGGGCNVILEHQLEHYDPTTGEYVAWVKVPSLSATTNTPIGMFYGNSAVVSDLSVTSVWSENFVSVYHLHDDFQDAAGANNGTNNGSSDLVGIIADGQDFDGNDYIDTGLDLSGENSFTVSAWVNVDVLTPSHILWQGVNGANGWGNGAGATHHEFNFSVGTCCPGSSTQPNFISLFMGRSEEEITTDGLTAPVAFTDVNVWRLLTGVISDISGTPTAELFIDGVSVATDAGVAGNELNPSQWNSNLTIARPGVAAREFDGTLDEIRISSVVRSDEWIFAEFRNQRENDTFYNISPEFTAATACLTLPVDFSSFNVKVESSLMVRLNWETASELNNDYFAVERSIDGRKWEEIARVNGAGNSNEPLAYTALDEDPYSGTSYYRIKQTDFDGTEWYSITKATYLEAFKDLSLYPNPASNELTIELRNPEKYSITFVDAMAREIRLNVKQKGNSLIYDVSTLESGIYFMKIKSGNRVANKKIIIL